MNSYWFAGFVIWSIAIGILGFEIRGWEDNASIEAAKDKQEIAVITKERKDQTITNGVDNAYQKNVSTLNLDYDAIMQRLYSIPSAGVPTVSKGTARPDATSCSNKFSRRNQEALIDLAKKADLQTQQLIYLQEWIKKQGMTQ